jgi:glycosyltransferase involved in cell wall biosynthesis
MKSAHVIYISPKMQTARNAWCLSDIAGQPAIRRLSSRLETAFGGCWMLCHEEATAGLIREATGSGNVVVSSRPGRYSALADFARGNELDYLVLYPDTAIFPDCEGAAAMIALHEKSKAAATLADRYPVGLYPEILSRSVLDRFENAESTQTARWLMEKANRASWDAPPFPVNDFTGSMAPAEVIEAAGASLLLWSGCAVEAASAVDSNGTGIQAAYEFGKNMRRSHPTVTARVTRDRVRILYATLATYYAGAEESFSLLAANVDKARFEPLALLQRPSMVSEKLVKGGVPVTIAPCDFGRMTPDAIAYLSAFLMQTRPDLVHIDSFLVTPLMLAAHQAGIPVVQHIRVLPGRYAAEGYQLADRTIAISEACRLDLLRSGLQPDRVVRVYNGLDPDRFRPRPRPDSDDFIILAVARVCEQKRQHYLISALSRLIERVQNCRVVFAGECHPNHASYLEKLRREIDTRGLTEHVQFAGFEAEIEKLYANADVSVLCSTSEAFGRCLVESMAMGVPVVAANDGGILEVVDHEVNGLLFEPYSVESLAASIERVARDSTLRERLKTNGIVRASQFSLGRYVSSVERVYESLISREA